MRIRGALVAAIGGVALFALAEVALTHLMLSAPLDRVSGVAAIGGPFTLVDDQGRTVSQATLASKPTALYFGYTYCPDVCPTTLADLSRWIRRLGPEADKANFIFVTIDPERDTPKVLHDYLAAFDPHIRGLTGTPAQIAQIAKDYKVYYKRVPTKGGAYLMDHSSITYLMGANGSFVGVIPYQAKDNLAVSKLKSLIERDS